jgi:bifunctional non-homologous end joining protein LigD
MAGIPVIKPMLAEPQKGRSIHALVDTYTFDVKLDGVRAIFTWDGQNLTITNRSGVDRTATYPDLVASCPLPLGTPVVLDGEIIATTGSFESIAKRDKQTKPEDVARVMDYIPVQFLAFDLLYIGDMDVRGETYQTRRAMLEVVMAEHTNPLNDPMWGLTVVSNQASLLDSVRELGMEGVIAKRNDAPYLPGRRPAWVKFKVTHRVTCIAVGYEPGEGTRSHFGAMLLAMLDEKGTPTQVGRVGTGFTTADTHECKALLDARTPFLVEIECANVTKSGVLRFPSYKGVRTDLSLADASMAQLATIPRS